MSTIAGTTLIARTPSEVHAFLADPRNEPAYNRMVLAAGKVTPGPIRAGTRFVQHVRSVRSRGSVVQIALLEHDPPHHLAWHITSAGMDVHGDICLAAHGDDTVVSWTWQFTPRGWLRVLGPLPAMLGARFERRVWAALKTHLEQLPGNPPAGPTTTTGTDAARG